MKKSLFLFVAAAMVISQLVTFAPAQNRVEHGLNNRGQITGSDLFGQGDRFGAAATTGGTAATTPMVNHGGPVINTPTIYIIWYGNWNQTNGTDTGAGQQIIRDWAANIGNSAHFNLNSSYPPTNSISGQVIFGGEYTNTGTKTRLRDSDILSIVNGSIGTGKLPYNAGGIYFVVTTSNISETSGFCTQYCGWHTAGNGTAGHLRYSFVGNAARCLSGCAAQTTSPNGNPGIDGSISVMTHELEEATSDPDLNAWYDSTGAENGDKCAWTFGHFQYITSNGSFANIHLGSRDYLIQRNLWYSGSSWFCMMDSTHN
jgi:hypothetical protein